MTLGAKLKELRTQMGFTQEQLAEKLCVSRQAVTKWESDKGMPDIQNLQMISELFNISLDELVKGTAHVGDVVLREKLNLTTKEFIKQGDEIIKEKFPDAEEITILEKKKKYTKGERIWSEAVEWLTLLTTDSVVDPGLDVVDSIKDFAAYYIVKNRGKELLVRMSKEEILAKDVTGMAFGEKFEFEGKYFKRKKNLV